MSAGMPSCCPHSRHGCEAPHSTRLTLSLEEGFRWSADLVKGPPKATRVAPDAELLEVEAAPVDADRVMRAAVSV